MTNRSIESLHPKVKKMAEDFLALCDKEKIGVLIYCTLRTHQEQAALYAQGRTAPGRIVTNAKPGFSFHNFGLAFDAVPMRNGKTVFTDASKEDRALWERIGEIGEQVGLEWGGRWKMVDKPHFQYTGGLTLAELRAGKTLA